jgi:hypothetical protein
MENVFAFSFFTYLVIFIVCFVVGFLYRLFTLVNFDVIWRSFQIYMGWREPYRRPVPPPPAVHPLDENYFPTTPFQELCVACPQLLPRLRQQPSLVHDIQGYVDKNVKRLNQMSPSDVAYSNKPQGFSKLTLALCMLVYYVPGNAQSDDDLILVPEYMRKNCAQSFEPKKKTLQRQSAVISSEGKHHFKIDNLECEDRREDLVHASVDEIHEVLRRVSPEVRRNTAKIKRAAERAHQKKKLTARELERCEKAFRNMLNELSFHSNEPQNGFNMGELLRTIGAAPGVFVQACNQMAKAAQATTEKLSALSEFSKNALSWLSTFVKTCVLCVAASIFVYAIYARRVVLAITTGGLISALALVQGAQAVAATNDLRNILDEFHEKLAQLKPERTYRGSDDDRPINRAEGNEPLIPLDQSLVSKLFVSVFSCGFFMLGDKKKDVFSVLKDYIVHFPSIIKGVDGAVEYGSKIALSLLNAVRKSLGFEIYDQIFEHRDAFGEWIHEVDGFLTGLETHTIQPSPGTLGRIMGYINEGRVKNQFLRSITDDSGAKNRLQTLLTRLIKASDLCISSNPGIVSTRPEPVCVFLYGKPGKGKTVFSKMLAKEWLRRTTTEEEYALVEKHIESYIYNRTPETEFWDGYANQAVCIFDDFLQKKEVAGGESAALDLVRAINGNPALLHMANLNDKGSSYFTSKFVILSCNIEVPNSEAIACMDAVLRRPDFFIALDFQPELRRESEFLGSSNVDTDLLAIISSLPAWEDKMSVYELTRYKITTQRQAVRIGTMSPTQLLEEILEKEHRNNLKFSGQLPENLQERIAEGQSLADLFKRRQHGMPGSKPRAVGTCQIPTIAVEPINKPQGYWEERFQDEALRTKEFYRLFEFYLESIKLWGVSHMTTKSKENALRLFLDRYNVGWDEFCVQCHPQIVTASNAYWKARIPDEEIRMIKAVPIEEASALTNRNYFRGLFETLSNQIRHGAGKVWVFFRDYWPWVVGAASAFGVALTLYGGLRAWGDADNESQSIPVKQRSRVPAVRRGFGVFRNPGIRQTPKADNQPQGGDDMQKQCIKLLRHNYHIFIKPKDERAVGHVQMLVDRIALVNAHVCDMVVSMAEEAGSEFVYLQPFGKLANRIEVPIECFEKVHVDDDTRDFDLVLVYLDNTGVQQAPDFRRYIPPLSDLQTRSQLRLLIPDVTANDENLRFQFTNEGMINSTHAGGYRYGDDEYTNEVNISYRITTMQGHCGLPVVTDSVSQGKYLVGIHKCGNGYIGGAAPVFLEWVERELDELKMLFPEIHLLSYQDESEKMMKPLDVTTNPNFPQCFPGYTEGVVPAFHATGRSKLCPLAHVDMFEQSTAPAQLDICKIDGHWVSPYHLNREKMPTLVKAYPKVENLRSLVRQIVLESSSIEVADLKFWCRKMTLEEAIYGIPGSPFRPLDLSTSVGYPYVLSGKTTKKAWLASSELKERLYRDIDHAEKLLQNGVRPLFLAMDCLKDERRPLEKVAQAATRVFAAGPFVQLVLCRMYFGGFCAWTQLNKIRNGIVIGMNPYSEEFDDMCRFLFRRSQDCFGGDSKAFDLCQHPQLLDAIFHATNAWYGSSSDNEVRLLLALDFKYARHVTYPVHVSKTVRAELLKEPTPEDPFVVSMYHKMINASDNSQWGFVYSVYCGHPSGNYLTACFNSWYSKCKPYVVVQWQLRDLSAVLDLQRSLKVVAMAMGDDFLISVHRSVQKYLNARKFAEFSAAYGMVVTREDKKPITSEFTDEALVFLKRTCRYEREMGRFVGALQMEAIIDAMCWMHKRDPTIDELTNTFNTALMEISFHGRGKYLELAPRVEKAARHTLRRPYSAWPWSEALARACKLEADYRP